MFGSGLSKVVFILLLCFSSTSKAGGLYLGLDFGCLEFDQTEFDRVDNSSVLIGYQFINWAIEGSYHYSETENEFFGGNQRIEMYHLYTAYRSSDEIYYKLKLGVTNERYKFSDRLGNLHVDDVHAGIARGMGVGYRIDKLNFELEYNWLGGSLKMLTGGIRIKF